jgi:PST family polysaccharide transporter
MTTRFKRNLIASVVAQLIRYGAPLAFYPYLTRTLGAEGFAEFALAFAAAVMLGQVVEFGFGLSGVRSLAESKLQPSRESSMIVGETIVGRVITSTAVVFLAALIWPLVNSYIKVAPDLVAISFFLALSYGFSPSWYFIGKEISAKLAAIEITVSLFQLLLIVSLIRSHSSPSLAVACITLPALAAAIYGNAYAIIDYGFSVPGRSRMVKAMKESFTFFCFTGIMPILNRANLLVLGAMSTPTQVAWYAVGERIVTAALNASTPVTRVVMPRVTSLVSDGNPGASRLFVKTIRILLLVSFLFAIVGAAAGPWVLPIVFGPELNGAAAVLAIQLFIVPAMMASRAIGTMALVPLRKERIYQALVLSFGIAGLGLAPLAVWLGDATGLSLLRLTAEACLAWCALLALRRQDKGWLRSRG